MLTAASPTDYVMESSSRPIPHGSPSESTRSTKLSIKSLLIDHDIDDDRSPPPSSPLRRAFSPSGLANSSPFGSTAAPFSPSVQVRLTLEEPPVVAVPSGRILRQRRSSTGETKRRQSERAVHGEERSLSRRTNKRKRERKGSSMSKSRQSSPRKSPRKGDGRSVEEGAAAVPSPNLALTEASAPVAPNKIRIRLRPSVEVAPSEAETPPPLPPTEGANGESKRVSSPRRPSAVNRKSERHSSPSPTKARAVTATAAAVATATEATAIKSPAFRKKKKLDHPEAKRTAKKKKRKNADPVSPPDEIGTPTSTKDRARPGPSDSPGSPEPPIINNEFCSACSGAGTLICCESCPKSFHFLCTDPPIDPDQVPDDKWFCNECLSKNLPPVPIRKQKPTKNLRDIWVRMCEFMDRMNPRVFTIPKRIRKLLVEMGPADGKLTVKREAGRRPMDRPTKNGDEGRGEMVMGEEAPMKGGREEGRQRVSEKGFCHRCSKGAGRDASKLLLCCDDCSLRWHLDCLPYPLAVYPSSHRHWACPLHLTRENLSHLPEATVLQILRDSQRTIAISDWPQAQSILDAPILPETSIRLQFGWSASAAEGEGAKTASDTWSGCAVPPLVCQAYETMRKTSARSAKLLLYYDTYCYADCSVEAANTDDL